MSRSVMSRKGMSRKGMSRKGTPRKVRRAFGPLGPALLAFTVWSCGETVEYNDYDLTLDMTACLGASPGGEAEAEGPSCRAQLDQTVSDAAVNACMLIRDVERDNIDYIPLTWKKGATPEAPGKLEFGPGAPASLNLKIGAIVEAELYFFRGGVDGGPLCAKGGGLEMNGECTGETPCLIKLKQPRVAIAAGEEGTRFDFGRRGGEGQCITEGSLMAEGDGSVAEICDGLDNDCDLQVDEGTLPQVGDNCAESIDADGVARQGICAPGQLACEAGALICRSEVQPNDRELCGNGIDEDCDGATDEADPLITFTPVGSDEGLLLGDACQLGQGECLTDGTVACDEARNGAAVFCNAEPPAGVDEICDFLDNDCDGRTDEGLTYSDLDVTGQTLNRSVALGQPCVQGLGFCRATGMVICDPEGSGRTVCNAELVDPLPNELCNAADDDCDGSTDEGFPLGDVCRIGNGACVSQGELVCTVDGQGTECDATPILPGDNPELCGDAVDNDCDGIVDEYLNGRFSDQLGQPCSVGTGACFNEGTVVCDINNLTQVTCGAQPGVPEATDQSCNGVDEDCDGIIDENYPEIAPFDNCGDGACVAQAQRACSGGEEVNTCNPNPPEPDDTTCNNIDEDCNGRVDEDFQITPSACGVGECANDGVRICVGGRIQDTCVPREPALVDSTCDGRDDDCDGVNDEDFAADVTQCGVGACAAEGQTRCVNGQIQDTCVAGQPGNGDGVCDGIDADCDGRTDENYISQATDCGVGQCAANGITLCINGQVQDTCTPGSPAANDRTCDARDDDCDGTNDENFVRLDTQCGVGQCARTGRTQCVNGAVRDSCAAGQPAPNDAICNGLDSDCDGLVDEDFASEPTECGVGDCFARGQTICQGGVPLDTCVAGDPGNDNNCNSRDEDCDGDIDEGYTRVPTECGVGECFAEGLSRCAGGIVQPNCQPGQPADDDGNCDGLDDDCDGLVDEDYANLPVNCGQGACAAQGFTTCIDGNEGDTCRADEPAADDPTCDGVDDDCDGSLDEDYVEAQTSCGQGICVRNGVLRCVNGTEQDTCQPGAPEPNDATCNQQDEDCNGQVDEDFPITATACGQGVCAAAGLRQCINGNVINNCTPGNPTGNDTDCDGVDDDCDGQPDDGYQSRNTSCGIGDCLAAGQTFCVNGQEQDSCTPRAPAPDDATCDGDDDDCDGQNDEDYPEDNVTSCGIGACAANGLLSCVNGGLQDSCTPGQPAATDNDCDGVDDDCDGISDEGFGQNVDCGEGACAAQGQLLCVNGGVVDTCREDDPAEDDTTCDGVDDDCDGTADEDYVVTPTNCGVGACAQSGQLQCVNGSVVDTCTPDSPALNDATCNDVDNDCDGRTDEDFNVTPTSCGFGICAADGQRICDGGNIVDTCEPGIPGQEVCNGLDDNCNGNADENFPLGDVCTVGLGQCERTGFLICDGENATQCNATPGVPDDEETCDGVDNDCDGTIDEDSIGEGGGCAASAFGICANGTVLCQGGALVCQPGTPGVEVCNGLDDDCDDEVDNVDTAGNACATGANNFCPGKLQCVGANVECVPDNPAAVDTCGDGNDNDCDGLIDEGVGEACDTGLDDPCDAGTFQCNAFVLECVPNEAGCD